MQSISPADAQQVFSDSTSAFPDTNALETALRDMTASLSAELADAAIEKRHDSLAHRTRVLRQMGVELALMRAHDAAAKD